MQIVQQLAFVAAIGFTGYLVTKRATFIYKNIFLGKDVEIKGDQQKRLGNMFRLAFGQQKMFDRPLVGLMHFAVYAGFLLINIEVLEIVLDGITGQHRIFANVIPSSIYHFIVSFFEIMALAVTVSCFIFLIRRNALKIPRFHMEEMKGWPYRDANIILYAEIILMTMLFSMNASDAVLQQMGNEHYPIVGTFVISQFLAPLFSGLSETALVAVERTAWWVHILGIFAFSVYITYSKHLHIFLAFPNTYFAKMEPKGKMENMESVTNEVKIMLGMPVENTDQGDSDEMPTFGAKDVQDLTWRNVMNAYSCTECGRCTSQCPANITGKKLSPRKVMMDVRDRAEEIGKNRDANGGTFQDDGKMLYGDYISKEELMACTSCNACAEACPINIDPLGIILEMRRYVAMEESGTPQEWNMVFQNIENNQAPWAFAASDRFKWGEELRTQEVKKSDTDNIKA
ncbi:(Fe-S)-binding protein [Flammeovirga sp. SJP92]|uniref:(Fe-S)-binding protein n=1 Tax=Flammeovirga sp. SJP92 TaxID=1775430 RepID=UPI0007893B7A|nr:(Fe-S)-binding protein [Flammeovirga sp. SJP92]KXX67432.1 Fe-S oxidoreductase [Flammeovirga sp. SJP92]